MHGHTGFLITTRRLAPGVTPPLRKRRPAKGAYSEDQEASVDPGSFGQDAEWTSESIGELVPSDKKIRRVRRSVTDTSVSSG
jgi:tRNA (adenine57-N1/adenine58-N1)-methyltransferase